MSDGVGRCRTEVLQSAFSVCFFRSRFSRFFRFFRRCLRREAFSSFARRTAVSCRAVVQERALYRRAVRGRLGLSGRGDVRQTFGFCGGKIRILCALPHCRNAEFPERRIAAASGNRIIGASGNRGVGRRNALFPNLRHITQTVVDIKSGVGQGKSVAGYPIAASLIIHIRLAQLRT